MNHGPTIRSGSTGNDVRRLQRLLVMMKSLGFDRDRRGVRPKHRRRRPGLPVRHRPDGRRHRRPADVGELPADPDTPVIRRGAHGAVVTALQKALRTLRRPGRADRPRPGGRRVRPADRGRGEGLPVRPRRHRRRGRRRPDVVGVRRRRRRDARLARGSHDGLSAGSVTASGPPAVAAPVRQPSGGDAASPGRRSAPVMDLLQPVDRRGEPTCGP